VKLKINFKWIRDKKTTIKSIRMKFGIKIKSDQMIRDEIEEEKINKNKIKTKQITIKRITNWVKKKTNERTHLFFGKEKREKEKGEEKKFIKPNHCYDGNTLSIVRKNMASCFKHHPGRQCLERERRYKHRLKNADIIDLLAHTKKTKSLPIHINYKKPA
jgi:hypothetical protein